MDPNTEKNSNKSRVIRIVLYVLCCMLAGAGALILARSLVNAAFLHSYNNGRYSTMPEGAVRYLKFGENYVVPYNMGNVEYKQGDYEKAVSYYREALNSNPPAIDEECRIRVNLALSMCHTINFEALDRTDQEAVSEAVTTLQSARMILTDHQCASLPKGSNAGHFADADLLKHDIDRMLEELQKQPDPQNNQDRKNNQDQNGGQDENRQKQQKESGGSQQEEEEKARQDELKKQLEQQKKDLESGKDPSGGNGFEYIEGGETKGYGEGTLW